MGLQAIQSNGQLYSQERDLAHNFGWLMRMVLARMNDRPWETVEEHLRHHGITNEQVSEGLNAVSNFVMSAKSSSKTLHEAMTDAGWLQVDPHVHLAVCAYIGSTILGAYYQGIQDACFLGDDPTKRYPNLREAAWEASGYYKKPTWRKMIRWAWQDFTRLFTRKKRA